MKKPQRHGPLHFAPLLMERVWGGNKLGKLFGRELPAGKIIGESWELSDRADAQSIARGEHEGHSFEALLKSYPEKLLGPKLSARGEKRFPLLIKYVDAGAALSVQVHPDDEKARAFNDRGKCECWVVVHAERGAKIVRGFKHGTTRAAYEKAVKADHVEELLHSFEPKAGDVVALPPGMVHAIGAGLVVAEVQQNSDLTFRIYDYKRVGPDGQPRKLHLKEALHAIRFDHPGDEFDGDMRTHTLAPHARTRNGDGVLEALLECRFFSLQRLTLPAGGKAVLPNDPHAPRIVMTIAGRGRLGEQTLEPGQTVLAPASEPELTLMSLHESPLTLLITVPK